MDRKLLKFKNDGHTWKSRSANGDKTRAREDTVSMSVNQNVRVKGAYAHHATNPMFRRRTYHLTGTLVDHLHLVHYLEFDDKRRRGFPAEAASTGLTDELDKEILAELLSEGLDGARGVDEGLESRCDIIDVSPEWADVSGGTKVVVVVSGKLPRPPVVESGKPPPRLLCGFGEVWVEAQPLGESALRCKVPPHGPGPVSVVLGLNDTPGGVAPRVISGPVSDLFEFREGSSFNHGSLAGPSTVLPLTPRREAQTFSAAARTTGKRPLSDAGASFSPPSPQPWWPQGLSRHQGAAATFGGGDAALPSTLASPGHLMDASRSEDVNREHKIRIVEKLEKVHTTISKASSSGLSPSLSGLAAPPSRLPDPMVMEAPARALEDQGRSSQEDSGERETSDGVSEDLLDDAQLTSISDGELEEVLERLLIRVVGHMVELAAADEGLQEELNAADRHGFCLLHYACLYNLGPMVPILLRYGALVNSVTLDGQTPLHLAASAGHHAIAESLVSCGADVSATDSSGLTPHQRAALQNYHDLAEWLSQLAQERGAMGSLPSPPDTARGPALAHSSPPQSRTARAWSSGNMLPSHVGGGLADSPPSVPFGSPESSSGAADETLRRRFSVDYLSQTPGTQGSQTWSPSTQGSSPADKLPLTQQNVQLLQDAFSSLSLKDKCLISKCVSLRSEDDQAAPPRRLWPGASTREYASEAQDRVGAEEVASAITESDKESLDVAMAMMGPDELLDMEKEARILQKNMKAWIMRRNYRSMRDSISKLQVLWRENRRPQSGKFDGIEDQLPDVDGPGPGSLTATSHHADPAPRPHRPLPGISEEGPAVYGDREEEAGLKLQALSRGMLARRNFRRIKQQTLAMIIIQRTLLARRSRSLRVRSPPTSPR
uniref:CG-1 domain-containing protein n=1 Tax=Rhizochromulina marina TaxID=1034831 RepID=A0A6U0XRL7_9STRA